jgi:hypothetical protein
MLRLAAVLIVLSGALKTPALEDRTLCNIPVFRYALERWRSSYYPVIVFHRGPLAGPAKEAVDELRRQTANFDVDHVDLAAPVAAKMKDLWESQKGAAEPWMVALYPGRDLVAWAGPASADSARRLADSPARQEMARRLLAGETAVWLFLESGDKTRDDASATLLAAELRRLEKALKLPIHQEDDPPLMADIPVKIAFSILRISRQDAVEKALIEVLLRSEADLNGPVTVPVFGRGRALWAFTGDGINASTIEEAGAFLTGACACEVKELNPGFDLPLAIEWEQVLSAARFEEPAIPTPVIPPSPPARREDVLQTPRPEEKSPSSRPFLWISVVGAGLLVLITGIRAFRR